MGKMYVLHQLLNLIIYPLSAKLVYRTVVSATCNFGFFTQPRIHAILYASSLLCIWYMVHLLH